MATWGHEEKKNTGRLSQTGIWTEATKVCTTEKYPASSVCLTGQQRGGNEAV